MIKPKLVLLAEQPPLCHCYSNVFSKAFECRHISAGEIFLNHIHAEGADAGIICLCSTEAVKTLLPFDSLPTGCPMIICANRFHTDLMRMAVQRGVDRFFTCDMSADQITQIILEAIQHGDLREYLEASWSKSFTHSPISGKLIDEIVRAFPRRLKEPQMAERLGKSRSSLQKLCKKAFGRTYPHLLRRIWVCQALRLMQHTTLDNGEIALHLNYTEESNLARDFRKELGYNPTEARQRLREHGPRELMG